jgi:quinol monooxygenase YgiN
MQKIEKNAAYLYCTAILRATEGTDYEVLKRELFKLEKKTVLEEGCIIFFVSPLDEKEKQFSLWEIWRDDEAFYSHHKNIHTQEYFSKKLSEVILFESSRKVEL